MERTTAFPVGQLLEAQMVRRFDSSKFVIAKSLLSVTVGWN